MGYYIALQKNIQSGIIKGYNVQAPNGEIVYVNKDKVKEAIKNKQAIFLNLMIDKSGRLISSSEHITGKLKVVAEAIKSITKDNYSDIVINNGYMETVFGNNKYILQSDYDCKDIRLLYGQLTYMIKSKDQLMTAARTILKDNQAQKTAEQQVNNNASISDDIVILYSDLIELFKWAHENKVKGTIHNSYTSQLIAKSGITPAKIINIILT